MGSIGDFMNLVIWRFLEILFGVQLPKQPTREVLRKKFSKNWQHFHNTFSSEHLWMAASTTPYLKYQPPKKL